ncbi:MAG: putative porin, partial [Verrucomicrobiota bacterium]
KLAYLVGFQIGENKKKGDWSLLANYRQVGLSAVDPQINDSDWALSQTNMAGFKVGFFYNIGDATTLGSSFYTADNLRSDLGGGANTYGPGSVSNSVKVLQVDLSVKF